MTPTHELPIHILELPANLGDWTKEDQSRFDGWFDSLPKDVCVRLDDPVSPSLRMAWIRRMGGLTREEQILKEPLLQFFAYEHLPDHLKEVSKPFGELAFNIERQLPRNPERTVALRKLLEAKDCAVRAVLYR